ncbi:MAG: hypothetical protein NC078_06130 [Ruminococcus sp.]|nr:hypothetical protein [Ruminococcus sp.]
MAVFDEALLGNVSDIIPQGYDRYAPLIGDWDFDYYDGYNGSESKTLRQVKGEWLFRKVLEGSAVQDIFICPSRPERQTKPQKDGEYGTAIRRFDFGEKCRKMFCCTKDYNIHVTWQKEQDRLVGTVSENPDNRFIFSEITENSFHWQNIVVRENGSSEVISNIYAKRK